MLLLALSLAPGLALVIFIYLKDKYEREPLKQVGKAFLYGALSAVVLLIFWFILKNLGITTNSNPDGTLQGTLDLAFLEAAIPEETLKWAVFLLYFYKLKDFNEWFDGIVYASVISLGFATVENVLYVVQSGVTTGIIRALFAVPAHFMDGVTQGFFFSLAKFDKNKLINITLALVSAIILHGIYDFLLFAQMKIFLLLFLPYFFGMIILTKKLINKQLDKSQFKTDSVDVEKIEE